MMLNTPSYIYWPISFWELLIHLFCLFFSVWLFTFFVFIVEIFPCIFWIPILWFGYMCYRYFTNSFWFIFSPCLWVLPIKKFMVLMEFKFVSLLIYDLYFCIINLFLPWFHKDILLCLILNILWLVSHIWSLSYLKFAFGYDMKYYYFSVWPVNMASTIYRIAYYPTLFCNPILTCCKFQCTSAISRDI